MEIFLQIIWKIYNSKGNLIGIVTDTSSNTINLSNYTNVDLVDDEYFYKKLPERKFTPGNQHSTCSEAVITVFNGVIADIQNHLHEKYFTITDYKGNNVTYIFENSGVTSGNISGGKVLIQCNVGISNDSSLIAAEIVTAINHSNGHGNYNTLTVTRESNIIIIKQKISGEIGNKNIKLYQSASLTETTELVGINNHGLTTGTALQFLNISNITGIDTDTIYYVSETTNTTNILHNNKFKWFPYG